MANVGFLFAELCCDRMITLRMDAVHPSVGGGGADDAPSDRTKTLLDIVWLF